jgi:hypothetical protein
MNKPPQYFTPRQRRSFYNDEKIKQDKVIKDLKIEMIGVKAYVPGDANHLKAIRLRVMLNDARVLRENYRAGSRRAYERMMKQCS